MGSPRIGFACSIMRTVLKEESPEEGWEMIEGDMVWEFMRSMRLVIEESVVGTR